MKYQVVIPRPSAKRMKRAVLIISRESGWETFGNKVFDVDLSKSSFEFEVDDSFEYIEDTTCNDGFVFDVCVEFSNDSGSRKEKFHLVPMKMEK